MRTTSGSFFQEYCTCWRQLRLPLRRGRRRPDLYPKDAKPVFFSHTKHVEGKNYKCSACHYAVFQMAKDSYKMDMSKITKASSAEPVTTASDPLR